MCGRYLITFESSEIKEIIENLSGHKYYNKLKSGEIFPSEYAPVLINKNGKKTYEIFKWGIYLIRHKTQFVINARAETILEKPMFKSLADTGRCLIIANAFYEWDTNKTKYLIKPQSKEMFFMAGLYGYFEDKHNEIVPSFTIVTTNANDDMKQIHHRMPVILDDQYADEWIFGKINEDTVKRVIEPYRIRLAIEKA